MKISDVRILISNIRSNPVRTFMALLPQFFGETLLSDLEKYVGNLPDDRDDRDLTNNELFNVATIYLKHGQTLVRYDYQKQIIIREAKFYHQCRGQNLTGSDLLKFRIEFLNRDEWPKVSFEELVKFNVWSDDELVVLRKASFDYWSEKISYALRAEKLKLTLEDFDAIKNFSDLKTVVEALMIMHSIQAPQVTVEERAFILKDPALSATRANNLRIFRAAKIPPHVIYDYLDSLALSACVSNMSRLGIPVVDMLSVTLAMCVRNNIVGEDKESVVQKLLNIIDKHPQQVTIMADAFKAFNNTLTKNVFDKILAAPARARTIAMQEGAVFPPAVVEAMQRDQSKITHACRVLKQNKGGTRHPFFTVPVDIQAKILGEAFSSQKNGLTPLEATAIARPFLSK